MEHCKKFDIKITGCSKQVSLFQPYFCQKCLKEEKENVRGDDNGKRTPEIAGYETIRTQLLKTRKRDAIREINSKQSSLFGDRFVDVV